MITTLDTIALSILVLFAFVGTIRGFIKEILSIFSWILCILVAFMYYDGLAEHVKGIFPGDFIPFIFSFVIIFATGLLIMSIISKWVSKMVKNSPLDGMDRLLGFLFGLVKGVFLIIFAAFILEFAGFQADWWSNSMLKVAFDWLEGYKQIIYEQLI